MAFSEFEQKKVATEVSQFIEPRRPRPEIRDQLDIAFKIENQSVILFEIRPRFDKPEVKLELPFAKATYSKKADIWKIYWLRADLKWHRYPPTPTVDALGDFLSVVEEDKHGCFWG